MKKFVFWVLTAIAYEVVMGYFGSYFIGTKIGESYLEMKKK